MIRPDESDLGACQTGHDPKSLKKLLFERGIEPADATHGLKQMVTNVIHGAASLIPSG